MEWDFDQMKEVETERKKRWKERERPHICDFAPLLLGESKGCYFLAAQNVFNHCPSYCGRWSVMSTIPLFLNLC